LKRADENSTIAVDFNGRIVSYDLSELDEFSLAYTANIHKSQCSEYSVVLTPRPPALHAAGAEPALHGRDAMHGFRTPL